MNGKTPLVHIISLVSSNYYQKYKDAKRRADEPQKLIYWCWIHSEYSRKRLQLSLSRHRKISLVCIRTYYIAMDKLFSQILENQPALDNAFPTSKANKKLEGGQYKFLIFKLNDLHHRRIANFLANHNAVMRFYDPKCFPMIQSNLQNCLICCTSWFSLPNQSTNGSISLWKTWLVLNRLRRKTYLSTWPTRPQQGSCSVNLPEP